MNGYEDYEGRPHELAELLSPLFPDFFGFRLIKARKEHVDEFGTIIKRGEDYFCREVCGQFGVYVRLSTSSFKVFSDALLLGNRRLFAGLQRESDARQEALMNSDLME